LILGATLWCRSGIPYRMTGLQNPGWCVATCVPDPETASIVLLPGGSHVRFRASLILDPCYYYEENLLRELRIPIQAAPAENRPLTACCKYHLFFRNRPFRRPDRRCILVAMQPCVATDATPFPNQEPLDVLSLNPPCSSSIISRGTVTCTGNRFRTRR
jgi:hypothetical protein